MKTILFSHRLRASPFQSKVPAHGAANYSYGIVAERLRNCLGSSGLAVHDLDFPGLYTTRLAIDNLRHRLAPNGRLCHIAVKPLDHVEIVPGIPNILHNAWEFDRITAARVNSDPHSNQIAMLGHFERILVPCTFQQQVFARAGLKQAVVIPTPVPLLDADNTCKSDVELAAFDFGAQCNIDLNLNSLAKSHGDRIFLVILNPFDPRKNFLNLLKAAYSAPEEMVTLFKLTIDNTFQTLSSVLKRFPIKRNSNSKSKVYMIPNKVSSQQLQQLQQLSNFILSASTGEGQNLPLLEAMACGAVAVAPRHTAMLDYINPETACIIPSEVVRAPAHSSYLGDVDLRAHMSDDQNIASAIAKALSLNKEDIQRMSNAGKSLVESRYSERAVASALTNVLGSIG
jgi:glycosyltransferase involved in cell wall biosynthesis